MSHKKTVEAFIQRVYQSYPADFYLSQWQKNGRCGAEFFNEDVHKAVTRISNKMTEAEGAAFFQCVPRTAEFTRMKDVLFRRFKDFDLTKASFMYHLYQYVKRQSLSE